MFEFLFSSPADERAFVFAPTLEAARALASAQLGTEDIVLDATSHFATAHDTGAQWF